MNNIVVFRLDRIKTFLSIVQLVKWANKQMVVVKVDESGLTLISTDESKCLQGTVQFKRQFFKEFWYGGSDVESSESMCSVFGLSLCSLVDTLGVFATQGGPGVGEGGGADLVVRWPDADAKLTLQLVTELGDDHRPVSACMTAQLGCEDAREPLDHNTKMTQQSSCFIIQTGVLREAVEDLEWPGGSVSLTLQDAPPLLPPLLTLNSQVIELGQLQIEVDLGHDRSTGQVVRCLGRSITHRYKYKQLRIACNVQSWMGPQGPQGQDRQGPPSSQVVIDEEGRLKVHHLLRIRPDQSRQIGNSEDASCVTVAAYFTLSPEELITEFDA